MNKVLSFALLYFTIGLTLAYPGGHFFSSFGWGHSSNYHTPTSICANKTTAPSYLSQTLSLINNYQANSSYNATLQLRYANFVAYLKNTTNQALVSSNCTAFVIGVKTAKYADDLAEGARQKIASYIQQQFRQVSHNATGSNGPIDVDSSGEHRGY